MSDTKKHPTYFQLFAMQSRYALLIFVFVVSNFLVHGQTLEIISATSMTPAKLKELDSLKALIGPSMNKSNDFDPLKRYAICREIVLLLDAEGLAEQSISWIDSTLTIENLDSVLVCRMMIFKGSRLQLLHRFEEADMWARAGQDIAQSIGALKEQARALLYFGNRSIEIGAYDSATIQLYKSLKIRRSIGDDGVFIAIGNIGLLHFQLSSYSTALKYLTEAKALSNVHNSDLHMNIAVCRLNLGDYPGAREMVLKEFEREDATPADRNRFMVSGYFILGVADLMEEKFQSARNNLKISARLAEEFDDRRFISYAYSDLGRAYLPEYPDSAVQALQLSVECSGENNYNVEILLVNKYLIKAYKMMASVRQQVECQRFVIDQCEKMHPIRLAQLLSLYKAEDAEHVLLKSLATQNAIIKEREEQLARQDRIAWLDRFLVATLIIFIGVVGIAIFNERRIAILLRSRVDHRRSMLGNLHAETTGTLRNSLTELSKIEACMVRARLRWVEQTKSS